MSKLTVTNSASLLTLDNRVNAATLLDMAKKQLDTRADDTALIFVPADGTPHRQISTREFFAGAARYAAMLRQIGIADRDLVILVMEHSEALLHAFWGALMVGAIPSIFPFLSEKLDPSLYFERVHALITHSGAKAVIASTPFVAGLRDLLGSIPVIDESGLEVAKAEIAFSQSCAGSDIAFLQHSSGSTGLQKGVALSHEAVLNQLANYREALNLQPSDVIVSWLPLYHDMGLIAGFVMPIAQGIPLVLMSPFHWVRDPKLLLQLIQQYDGTLCWLPNFAYNFTAARVRDSQIEGLRLDSMRLFINCSEPTRAESHRQFAHRFEKYGVKPESLVTCYAMAENTFAVTQSQPQPNVDLISRAALSERHQAIPAQDGELNIEMLSNGKPIPNCRVKIVDEMRQELPARHVGEIAVQSDSMLTGYYRRDDLTAQALIDGWYLTGDYGYLVNGELYITGRKKDLIIVGGKNVYPQDLETLASDVPGVHAGRVVAFGVDDDRLGTESIVMVVEADDQDEDIRSEIGKRVRAMIAQQTDVTLGAVHVVDRGWLHKTSSGKIARSANREKYLSEISQ
ncbi:MAG: AMP-binding protein [Anaerolineae bacterium]|nr:AMP-binding protein [Anaerolineae bacterium]